MSTIHTTEMQLYPIAWENNPKTVLCLGFLQTTGNSFGANVSVIDKNKAEIKKNNVPQLTRDFSYFNIDHFEIPFDSFPITIQVEISCETDFDLVAATQTHIGTKRIEDRDVPICYQVTALCNDNKNSQNRDLDFNDFILMAQLFNHSTD